MEGGKLPSFCPSEKSGGKLLEAAPKFVERGFAPLQEGRGLQVWPSVADLRVSESDDCWPEIGSLPTICHRS